MPLKKVKYTKAKKPLLDMVLPDNALYACLDGRYWICKTCDKALSRDNMPVQYVANNLSLSTVPSELNRLEIRLLCLRVAFMKLVALPCGKQRCIHGPAVNIPIKLDSVVDTLPRLPDQSQLIPLKFKRKMSYKGHYMYDFITPQKIIVGLELLKASNPHYESIQINKQWAQDCKQLNFDLHAGFTHNTVQTDVSNDSSLVQPPVVSNDSSVVQPPVVSNDSSVVQPPHVSNDSSVVQPINTPFMPVLTPPIVVDNTPHIPIHPAEAHLQCCITQNNLVVHEVPGDGDCLFWSVVYQPNTCVVIMPLSLDKW